MKGVVTLDWSQGVFAQHDRNALAAFFAEHGFAILRGLFSDAEMAALQAECEAAQQAVAEGRLAERHGNSILTDAGDGQPRAFVNYVQYLTLIAPKTREAILHPAIASLMSEWIPNGHLRERSRFGVVYQDARGGAGSGYRRIGWHSDWQAHPHLDVWPSVAFTLHIDGTSPENGFLRVVPGSHRWATPAPHQNANGVKLPAGSKATGGHSAVQPPFPMPMAFEKRRGEFPVYCEPGDVLFHDAYLWHSASSATADEAVRRHVRGGWFTGEPDAVDGDYLEDFVKNAAR